MADHADMVLAGVLRGHGKDAYLPIRFLAERLFRSRYRREGAASRSTQGHAVDHFKQQGT